MTARDGLPRLLAAALTLAASLPGPLELAHDHEGGGLAHVHAPGHPAGHGHAHHHGEAHAHRAGVRASAPGAADSEPAGPALHSGDDRHVHALSPLQRAARTAALSATVTVPLPAAATSEPIRPQIRTARAPRPRGPPVLLG